MSSAKNEATNPICITAPQIPMPLSVLTTFLLSILTGFALWQHGYWGIMAPHFESTGAGQVLFDLVIALLLLSAWMWKDAKAKNRAYWPWFILTLAAGSFGPLLYLIFYAIKEPASKTEQS